MSNVEASGDPTMWTGVMHGGLAGTFLRVPYVPARAAELRSAGATEAIYGMPWDSMAASRSGASYGPRGIREATAQFLPYNATWDFDLHSAGTLVDCADGELVIGNAKKSFERAQKDLEEILEAGAMPILLGGDHSTTIPAVRAVASRNQGAGLVLIDTHLDTALDVAGEELSNCCPISRAIDAGFDPKRTVLIGISGWLNPRSELEYCQEKGITVIWIDDVWRDGIEATLAKALDITGRDGDVYLTVDVDGLDAAYGPGTSTPTTGGLTSRELLTLVRGLAAPGLLGLDVVETAPDLEHGELTARMAVRVILDVLAARAGAVK